MDFVFLDTEFNRKDFTKRGLVSFSLVTEHASYYAVNGEMDAQTICGDPEIGEWMTENVFLPHIPHHGPGRVNWNHEDVKDYATISAEANAFLKSACPTGNAKDDIEIIVKCGAQDMVRLHTLISDNDWSQFGPWIPQGSDDMYRIQRKAYRLGLKKEDLPVQDDATVHHALFDAEHEMRVHSYIRDRFGDL
jgi:hypothetical protein